MLITLTLNVNNKSEKHRTIIAGFRTIYYLIVKDDYSHEENFIDICGWRYVPWFMQER